MYIISLTLILELVCVLVLVLLPFLYSPLTNLAVHGLYCLLHLPKNKYRANILIALDFKGVEQEYLQYLLEMLLNYTLKI